MSSKAHRTFIVKGKSHPAKKPMKAIKSGLIDMIRSAGYALGSAAAGNGKSKKSGVRKDSGNSTSSSVTVGRANAPVSSVRSLVINAKRGIVTIPFDVCTMGIFSNSLGVPQFGSTTSGLVTLPLDPNATIVGVQIFGNVQATANTFRRYRILDFSCTYEPMVPTNNPGNFVAAVVDDGGLSNAALIPYSTILGCDGAIAWPAWLKTVIPARNICKDWLWVQDATARTTSTERQTNFASLVIAAPTPTTLTALTFFGFLRFRGTFQFYDNTPNLVEFSSTAPLPIAQNVSVEEKKEDHENQLTTGTNLGPSSIPPSPSWTLVPEAQREALYYGTRHAVISK